MAEPLSAILASQERLINEAAEALPHQFNVCTYSSGYLRQAVYLCLTCAATRGICSACSIACHTDHEQVELFPKRHFRCDCPTEAIQHPCTLHRTCEEENSENFYGQNFQGIFCRCGRSYDAKQERETMIQCLVCEVNIGADAFLSGQVQLLVSGLVSRVLPKFTRATSFARSLTGLRGSLT